MNNDSYGSAHREMMKQSMEKPAVKFKPAAETFKPLNRVQPFWERHSDAIEFAAWVVIVILFGVISVFGLDKLEGFCR